VAIGRNEIIAIQQVNYAEIIRAVMDNVPNQYAA